MNEDAENELIDEILNLQQTDEEKLNDLLEL